MAAVLVHLWLGRLETKDMKKYNERLEELRQQIARKNRLEGIVKDLQAQKQEAGLSSLLQYAFERDYSAVSSAAASASATASTSTATGSSSSTSSKANSSSTA